MVRAPLYPLHFSRSSPTRSKNCNRGKERERVGLSDWRNWQCAAYGVGMGVARRIVAYWVGVALLLVASQVRALGSCGTGGPTGRHINVPFAPSEYWVWAPADQ